MHDAAAIAFLVLLVIGMATTGTGLARRNAEPEVARLTRRHVAADAAAATFQLVVEGSSRWAQQIDGSYAAPRLEAPPLDDPIDSPLAPLLTGIVPSTERKAHVALLAQWSWSLVDKFTALGTGPDGPTTHGNAPSTTPARLQALRQAADHAAEDWQRTSAYLRAAMDLTDGPAQLAGMLQIDDAARQLEELATNGMTDRSAVDVVHALAIALEGVSQMYDTDDLDDVATMSAEVGA